MRSSAANSHDPTTATAKSAGVTKNRVQIIRDTLEWNHSINSLSQLASVKSIELKTLEKCFRYVMDGMDAPETASPTLI